jgi:hypothetical protein
MVDQNRKSEAAPDHDRSTSTPGNGDIIPGRHGKHGGSLESEGEPQDEGREANPPRKAEDSSSGR